MSVLYKKAYSSAINKTLWVYENYFLPRELNKNRVSLVDLKKQEFNDRKKMLNPYQKEIISHDKTDQIKHLESLGNKVSLHTMKNFSVTYNRHKGKYDYRSTNFPDSIVWWQSPLDYSKDPDWTNKLVIQRINFKKLIVFSLLFVCMIKRRLYNVQEFDRAKRREQRAMQNEEVDEVHGKGVKLCLFSY